MVRLPLAAMKILFQMAPASLWSIVIDWDKFSFHVVMFQHIRQHLELDFSMQAVLLDRAINVQRPSDWH